MSFWCLFLDLHVIILHSDIYWCPIKIWSRIKAAFLTVNRILGDWVKSDHGNAVVELHVILLISPHLVINKTTLRLLHLYNRCVKCLINGDVIPPWFHPGLHIVKPNQKQMLMVLD